MVAGASVFLGDRNVGRTFGERGTLVGIEEGIGSSSSSSSEASSSSFAVVVGVKADFALPLKTWFCLSEGILVGAVEGTSSVFLKAVRMIRDIGTVVRLNAEAVRLLGRGAG